MFLMFASDPDRNGYFPQGLGLHMQNIVFHAEENNQILISLGLDLILQEKNKYISFRALQYLQDRTRPRGLGLKSSV